MLIICSKNIKTMSSYREEKHEITNF